MSPTMRWRRPYWLALSLSLFFAFSVLFALARPLAAQDQPASVDAPCAGGPVIDGITLDECYIHNFNVNGDAKTIRVWYTKDTTEATREVDGSDVTLQHWITSDAQAVQVAQWFQEAWVRYNADSGGHHLYDKGCSNTVNVQMEDGVGWSGIAYWASSGNCNIGIDAPMVRNGGGQRTVYHEAQHYLQYSYDDGCYADLKANYMSGTGPGNAEFTEGYADLGSDSVNSTIDANYLLGSSYNPETSMYVKNYGNRFVKYLIEQLGTIGSPSDPWHRIDAMYKHYKECDDQDTLYVLDDLIPQLSGGQWSMEEFFLNFFAANWAEKWADPATQSELVYLDDDGTGFSYSAAPLRQNVNMSSGVNTWSESTPDTYAARYYRVNPLPGCEYVQVEVDGQAGAMLGINLMAAKTSSPSSVLRSAYIGEDYVRTFAGAGVHNRIVAVVNSFDNTYNYDVTFSCVSPAIQIMEPRQTNFALVGEPASPLTFLTRLQVTSGGSPVRGLVESSFTFDAEGDAPTVLPNSFQQVGEEYWAVMQAPVKPAGTAFVDYQVCLDGGVLCDSETDALLYAPPGNSDIAITVDASGSMGTEDVIGEGTRLINAQRAAKVVADLARMGDRLMVTDFSAKNDPPGCGNTTNDCVLDLRLLLPRSDVVVPATIDAAKAAIDAITDREWTPIGAALQDAKNKLLAAPFSENPKHIFLLSDGEENVNPMYADVRAELIESGVVINTIAFGPEADSGLMAQIAADTGGLFRPVPTTDTGSMMAASAASLNMLAQANAPQQMTEIMAGPSLPGQLGLADVYDNFDTDAQDATRIFHVNHTNATWNEWRENYAIVDKSVTTLRFVVAGKQNDSLGCEGWHRDVEVWNGPADSDPQEPRKEWIPISPIFTGNLPPANWNIRNSIYDDVLIVTNPDPGLWRFRVRYRYQICAAGANGGDAVPNVAATPDAPQEGLTADFMMNMSVQSPMQLEGRILGLTNLQGEVGDEVAIVATLLGKEGAMPGAFLAGLVQPEVGGPEVILLLDDGLHNDGQAGDGIYGWNYTKTYLGGAYNVRLVALFKDPNDPDRNLLREWNGGFWLEGIDPELQPDPKDPDGDGMPTKWEERCGLDPKVNDAKEDPDGDGLPNGREFVLGTLPCVADTDHGGESDGSEVGSERNPLWPNDDKVRPIRVNFVRPLNRQVLIDVRKPGEYDKLWVYVSTDPDEPGRPTPVDPNDDLVLRDLTNDQTYYIWIQGEKENAKGDLSQPQEVTPKADPDPPAGAVLIENGAAKVSSKEVTLYLTATDEPLPGMAQSANGHLTDQLSGQVNEVSGNVEMRVSNSSTMASSTWEPLVTEKPWTLACEDGEVCTVYVQFRDGAENESMIASDSVLLEESSSSSPSGKVFLPIVTK